MKLLLPLLIILPVISTAQCTRVEALPQVVVEDQARIREHLASVEEYLRSQDTSHLTLAQRRSRATSIETLHDYWVAGVFPRNILRSYPTPIFIDQEDRACAVAHLMIESGWDSEAKAVAARENLAYVNDIRSPEVAEWIARSGFTVQEAAWIQPTYGPPPCIVECGCDEDPVCAADGVTYINPCVAECYEEETYVPGCCATEDQPGVWEAFWCRCDGPDGPSDECEDESYVLGLDLCGDVVAPPPETNDSAPETNDSGCTAAGNARLFTPAQLLLAGLILVAIRRRRREH